MTEEGGPPEAEQPQSQKPERVSGTTRTLPTPVTRHIDLRLLKETTSAFLARGLLFVFAVVVAAVLLFAFIEDAAGAVDLAVTILPYVGTPLALALGYYFGISAR